MRYRLGFTLVEMMIVVAIIGILSSITYVGFSDARDDAANKAIAAELKNMQIAIELYKSENGVYPDTIANAGCSNSGGGTNEAWIASPYSPYPACSANTPYINGLDQEFIAEQMSWEKSRNDLCVVSYYVDDDQSWYKLAALFCFAGATDPEEGLQLNDDSALCPSGCAACNGILSPPPYEESQRFYTSMAVYGGDLAAACI